jgi:hypothetical protein
MIPMPTSRVFRSRRGALLWSFWVLVAAVMTVGFGDASSSEGNTTTTAAHVSEGAGTPAGDAALEDALRAMNAT